MNWALTFFVLLLLFGWLALPPPEAGLQRIDPVPGSAVKRWLERLTASITARLPGRRRASVVTGEFPLCLELMAACLQAGAPMPTAVRSVAQGVGGQCQEVLDRVLLQLKLGRGEPEAWLSLAEHPIWGAVARDVARSARCGTSLVEVLRVHADQARRRCAVQAMKAARAVGVRSVLPLMVCFLPAFVLVGVVPIIAGLVGGFFAP